MLSRVQLRIEWYRYNITNEVLEKAKTALDIAVELNPKSIEVKKAEGYYYYYGFLNYDKALKIFKSVLQSRPNDSEVIGSIGKD